MEDNNYFSVGGFNVSMEIQDGEAGEMTAEDSQDNSYEGGFVWVRAGGGKCMICRRINGTWVCQEIGCGVLDMADSSQQKA